MNTPVQEFLQRLSYTFYDSSLLRAALQHPSLCCEGNFERLEFLGDRVLNLCVADLLYRRFPNESEGDLAHRYSALVRLETCAAIAAEIGLDKLLNVASGTPLVDSKVLCDALEALIGAIYLDGGVSHCRIIVKNLWNDSISNYKKPPQDPKSELQELAQAGNGGLPEYVVIEKTGTEHAPIYRVAARIRGMDEAIGIGNSKRMAEKNAAAKLLESFQNR